MAILGVEMRVNEWKSAFNRSEFGVDFGVEKACGRVVLKEKKKGKGRAGA